MTVAEHAIAAQPRDGVDLSMIVDGARVEAANGVRYTVMNPASRRAVGTAPLGGADDAARAIEAALRGLETWRDMAVATRADRLGRALDAVSSAIPDLAALLTCEQGKPIAEAASE